MQLGQLVEAQVDVPEHVQKKSKVASVRLVGVIEFLDDKTVGIEVSVLHPSLLADYHQALWHVNYAIGRDDQNTGNWKQVQRKRFLRKRYTHFVPRTAVKAYTPVVSAFRINELPVTCLAIVFGFLTAGEAAEASMVNKKFLEAHRHEASWKKRCERLKQPLPQSFDGVWHEYYRREVLWRIRIVTIFGHRNGTSLSGDLCVLIDPDAPLTQLTQVIENDPRMRQHYINLYAFDPNVIGSRMRPRPTEPKEPLFVFKQSADTVRASGLFYDAELATDETMMRD